MLTATMMLSVIFESPFGPQLTTMKTAASLMLLSTNVFIARQIGYFDPLSSLCLEEKCIETSNGESMYLDSYHLSKFGLARIAPDLAIAIQTAIKNG
jgi:hypothetical protein